MIRGFFFSIALYLYLNLFFFFFFNEQSQLFFSQTVVRPPLALCLGAGSLGRGGKLIDPTSGRLGPPMRRRPP